MRVGRSEEGGGRRGNQRGFGDGVEDDFCFLQKANLEMDGQARQGNAMQINGWD